MSPVELNCAISALASVIASGLSDGEISLLSCIFVQLGDTLATIVTKNAFARECRSKKEE